jgi:hypothetical protein
LFWNDLLTPTIEKIIFLSSTVAIQIVLLFSDFKDNILYPISQITKGQHRMVRSKNPVGRKKNF